MKWRFLILLCAVVFALCLLVAAMPSPWYSFGETFTEYPTKVKLEKLDIECSYFDDCFKPFADQFRSMWYCIFAALILAIAFTALEAFILFLWSFHCFHKMKFRSKLRIPLIIIAFLATLASLASWALLLWQPHALGYDMKDFYNGDTNHPHAGWYLAICASAVSLLVSLILPCAGSPDHKNYLFLN